jgi:hypothetical protein
MARRPTQQSEPQYSTPTSQGNVLGGSASGLAGNAGWEIGRLRADIDNLKERLSELESEAKGVKTFHTYAKAIASVIAVVLAILAWFIGNDLKTILEMADAEQVHKADIEQAQKQLMFETNSPAENRTSASIKR